MSALTKAAAQSVRGVAEIGFATADGSTRLAHLYQHDPLRLLGPQLMQLIEGIRLQFRP